MLLRVIKYKASLDLKTEDEFYDAEFKNEPDPRLSVYEVDGPHRVDQVQTEHSAAADNYPPRGSRMVDVRELAEQVCADAPDGPFAYIKAAHYEIELSSQAEVRQFSDALFKFVHASILRRETAELRAYVHARVTEHDPEWVGYLEKTEKEEWKGYPKPAPPPKGPAKPGGSGR